MGTADVLLQEVHIGLGRSRADPRSRCMPRMSHFQPGSVVNTGFARPSLAGDGEVVGHFAVDLIAGADRDLVQIAQHVQAGQGNLGGALHHAAVLGGHGVEPAYPAGTAGGGAELALVAAPAAQLIALLAQKLADEGARSWSPRQEE